MYKKLRMFCAFSLVSVLVLLPVGAQAQVAGGGWISYSPSFTVQQRGCGIVNGLNFQLTCSTASGDQRAERRYVTYTSGVRQFEGFVRVVSLPGTRISLKQTFNEDLGAYFMVAVERGGRLYLVHGGNTIGSAPVGATVRINTVHTLGSNLQVYVNGSLARTVSSPSGRFYDKFGSYRTNSGQGPANVQWSGIRFWRR